MKKKEHLVKGLEWVEARVPNYAEMVEFYHRTLGLPVNFEEERKDFIQFRIGGSKAYLALLDAKKTGSEYTQGFIPTLEVSDLDRFVGRMKKKGCEVRQEDRRGRARATDRLLRCKRLLASGIRVQTEVEMTCLGLSLSTNNAHL